MTERVFGDTPSLMMRLAVRVLAAGDTKQILADGERTMEDAARNQSHPERASRRTARRASFTARQVAGIEVIEVAPRRGAASRAILYIHGGGYINPMVSHHWALLADLATKHQARVIAPQYVLAPEGDAKQALQALGEVYAHYFAGADEGPLVAGDSAGGGLALALAAQLRDDRVRPRPSHLGLFAPWVDVTLANSRIGATEHLDPTLSSEGLRHAGQIWAGALDPTDPIVSPINADLAGLPATTIFVGGRDIFRHDCENLVQRLSAAGVDAELHIAPGAFHAFPVAAFLPESRRALRHLVERSLA